MAKQPTDDAEADAEQPAGGDQKKGLGRLEFLGKFWTAKWLAILLGISVVAHGIGITASRLPGKAPPPGPAEEISLGEFEFLVGTGAPHGVSGVKFALHIGLLNEAQQVARQRLTSHRFRVQQDIEELLRRAHGADFDDPGLEELKRQLQEQINESLGVRAIADVLITDLKIQRTDTQDEIVTETAESVPWVTKPAG